jgi:glycine/D-amino acid oxidase-like deaminating enzyme/nitrite reductase/ring-hydroxylating ferredoxin subunit
MSSNMRSTPSWTENGSVPTFSALSGDTSADVCVIGAGIAGLTAAYMLVKEGKKVIVLDDGEIAGGETGRTTAHLVSALDDRFYWLEKIHGQKRTRLAAESHREAISTIERIVKNEKIDCDFRRVSGYLFEPDGSDNELKKELEAAHRAGLTDVRLDTAPFLGIPGLHFPNQGQFHILKYMRGLSQAILAHGGIIHTKTHVKDFDSHDSCTVETDDGYTATAHAIVIATNAPIHDNVQVYGKQAAYRTFVIAAKIKKGSMEPALLWDTPSPYHYVRIQESDDHDLLIVGGEDHKTGQANDAELRFANLERWTRSKFPQIGDVAYSWAGQVMEPADGLALIGKMPMGKKNVYITTGDSGNGMTHGTIAGILLTDLILKRDNPWEDVYNPSRIRIHSGKEFVKENVNTACEAVGKWIATGGPKEHDLQPGMGAVFAEGTKKIALYVDDDGTRHEFSAICPHKGCIVQWNSFDKSFDCPCHGSRFTCKGEAVNGPTNSNLNPLAKKDRKE